ncbi:aspartate aminotransferase family protein [Pseudomaricurvus alkylphenolicus]|uniref:aminotransferase family protein n=1 Tax=Pseudomaricurvus alkylphenolicus TaxID=1306991 RepID=UPI00142255ED|nr:aminotransferase class III-fold pyridoxal phosphate-dependent enzyme [Pseudomaricurvus alkylphenolicus]NIB41598.1 aspartate aminotransferase family protein [Pseudomaricurvus alkylphenolicus]
MDRILQFVSPAQVNDFPHVSHGEGVYLWDKQGRQYLDGSSGAVTANIGHGNARVREAMLAQFDKVVHAYGRVWDNDASVALSERLCGIVDWGYDACFYVSGGSEAVETAVKFAKQAAYARGETSRWKVISRTPSYHGATMGLLGITGDPDFGGPFEKMFVQMPKVSAPLTYRAPDGLSPEENAKRCLVELEQTIIAEGADSVLAFIMEPIGGTSSGCLIAPDLYYSGVRQICDKYGLLLIFDEILSGSGRSGTFLAAQQWPDCRPDIVALAKGLSGGYAPLGGILTNHDLVQPVREMGGFFHGHTYAGNPMSCAIGVAVLDEMRDQNLLGNAEAMGTQLRKRLECLKESTGLVGDVRGRGLALAIEIVSDRESKAVFSEESNALNIIKKICMDNGLMLLSRRLCGGRYGEWLMVTPPLIINAEQVDELVNKLEQSLLIFKQRHM